MEHSARRQRVRLVSLSLYRAVSDRPIEDQALAINELIETYLTPEARRNLRNHTYVERERYLGARQAVYDLREKYWTAENWLELRLTKYIATGVFRLGYKLFSMVQNDEGAWERQVLVAAPSNLNRARQDFIYGPLPVPSPFRHPSAVADAQKTLLAGHHFEISEDGVACGIDVFGAAASAVAKAKANKNLDETKPMRVQTLADGVGYYRGGRQATRFGVRITNLKRNNNSKYYFSNVSLFLASDHFAELGKYLKSIYQKLNAGLRTTPSGTDAKGNQEFTSSLFSTEVAGCGECEIVDGGDAACANASAGLEPPPSKRGCCSYCEDRRSDWFTRSKCDKAQRRTLFRSALLAHRLPPGAPLGATYKCRAPGCNKIISLLGGECGCRCRPRAAGLAR
jgi:hypothetical protein